MNKKILKKVNQDFFKNWTHNMAYILGFFIADGCVTVSKGRENNPYTFNITSVDLDHLEKIKNVLESEHKISKKQIGKKGYQIQVRNQVLCNDLINLGIRPRKTYNLGPIEIPREYFSDFVRGFFDGDGSVYIYNVNKTLQIKVGFVCVSLKFLKNFNIKLCEALRISKKSIHRLQSSNGHMPQYSICFYVDDSKKLEKFMYGNNPNLHLDRKKDVFDRWKLIKRRRYKKGNYPSKIGWRLNEGVAG